MGRSRSWPLGRRQAGGDERGHACSLDLVCDPLPLSDYLSLWDRLKKQPLSVNYLVRMLLIDSDDQLTEGPAVIEREFLVGSTTT